MTQMIFAAYDHMALLADYHTPDMHAHLCSHFALATEGELTYTTDSQTGSAQGVFIGSDVRHTIQSNAPLLIFFFDETSSLGARIKELYLGQEPVAEAAALIVEQTRSCLNDFIVNPDAVAFDQQTMEILLGAKRGYPSNLSLPTAATNDERISDVLEFLHAQDGIERDVVDVLAAREYLSKSRLSHLFSQEMGISLHR